MAKNIAKSIGKYLLVFLTVLLIAFLALVVTAKIPRDAIKDNIIESSDTFFEIMRKNVVDEEYKTQHVYADSMLLNIIYYIDNDHPVKSTMEAKYFSHEQGEAISFDVATTIEQNPEANTQYIRYWHGSMSIIRPLLVFFNIEQIYIISAIVLGILAIILLIKVRKIKELVVALLLGFIMCFVWIVPFCIEYTWVFLIMLITSLIAIHLEKKNKKPNILFLVTGMLTCYFDFLTNEIITLFVPLLILLTIRYKENKITNFKEGIKACIMPVILWTIGYIGMWISKWILASIILNVNALDFVTSYAMRRINGQEEIQGIITGFDTIKRNFMTLFPVKYLIENHYIIPILVCIIGSTIVLIRKKNLKELWFSGLLLLIALVPYIRYIVIRNHSYVHYFFVFRTQIIAIIAIVLAIVYSYDKELFRHKIKIKRKEKC